MNSDTPRPQDLQQLRAAIRAFVLSRVKDAALADDITQETLLRLHKGLHSLRKADRLDAWVFQIARNVLADHFRRTKESYRFDEDLHGPEPLEQSNETLAAEEENLRSQLAAYVRSVIDSLPEIYRDALRATEFEGISQVELAARLGLSVSAAKSRVQRARAMLRDEMERCCRFEADRYGTIIDVQPNSPDCCKDSGSCSGS